MRQVDRKVTNISILCDFKAHVSPGPVDDDCKGCDLSCKVFML